MAATRRFGTDEKTEARLVECRWPDGIRCAYCEGDRISNRKTQRHTPRYHCKVCRKNFTVKTGIVMHNSRLPLSKWAIASTYST